MENQPFSSWNREKLTRVLTDTRIPFDSARRQDIEYLRECVSQIFIETNQSKYNPETVSMNVQLLHEQHTDNANKLNEILGSLMDAVAGLRSRLEPYTTEIQDYENFDKEMNEQLAALGTELRQRDCSLMFIGETGAGKSKCTSK